MSDLTDLIAQVRTDTGDPDPHVTAAKTLPLLNNGQLHEAALVGLGYLARRDIRDIRRAGPEPDQHTSDTQPRPVTAPQSRWAKVAAATWNLHDPYETDQGWKRLGSCTLSNVEYIAARYTSRAATNQTRADQFTALADAMRTTQAETVADLDHPDPDDT